MIFRRRYRGRGATLRLGGGGGGVLISTRYCRGTRHPFLLNLYNSKNNGGGGSTCAPRPPCTAVPTIEWISLTSWQINWIWRCCLIAAAWYNLAHDSSSLHCTKWSLLSLQITQLSIPSFPKNLITNITNTQQHELQLTGMVTKQVRGEQVFACLIFKIDKNNVY